MILYVVFKSNQILFLWHLSYFKSNTKCLTEAKNNYDKTYQPSHHHKYPERYKDKQTHTCTHTQTHKLRPTAPIRQRHGRAPRPKARKKPPLGPTTLRGLLGHDHREHRHRDSPDPGRQEAPHQGKVAPSVVGPHEETLELKTKRLKQ